VSWTNLAMNGRILIVDDELAHVHALCDTLRGQAYDTTGLASGEAALSLLAVESFDLLLVDLMMPGMNGIAVVEAARLIDPDLACVIMTGEGTIASAVQAMKAGALDYVVKPFSPREVAARVRAILKRMAPRAVTEVAPTLFRIDSERVQICYRGQLLSLTRHEFRLLQCLLEQPERVFSREQLLDALGVAADAGYERSIDSHIKSVRAKLRLVKADAEPIQTHRGLGYSYSPGHS